MMDNSFITQFDSFEIIAGNDFSLEFEIFDENNKPVDLTGSTCKLTLAPIDNLEYSMLTRKGTVFGQDHNYFRVTFSADETRDLYSKYVYQPVIIDRRGREFCRAQGTIYFSERSKEI